MGVRNQDREAIERLESKTLDARFTTEIQQGLNCSLRGRGSSRRRQGGLLSLPLVPEPSGSAGKMTLIAVAADEPAGKPVSHCKNRPSV